MRQNGSLVAQIPHFRPEPQVIGTKGSWEAVDFVSLSLSLSAPICPSVLVCVYECLCVQGGTFGHVSSFVTLYLFVDRV